MGVSVVLVLDDVVEDLQQEGQVPVGVFPRIQEFRRRKELEQIDQLDGRYQRHGSPVGRNVANNRQKARVERYKLVGTIDHKLVEGLGLTELERLGSIDRTPGIPGSEKNRFFKKKQNCLEG